LTAARPPALPRGINSADVLPLRPTQRPRLLLGAGFILLLSIFLDNALRLSGSRFQSIW
jgi:hypothetical protein